LRAHPGDPDATLLAIELARRANDQKRLSHFYSQLRPSPLRARAAAMVADETAAKAGPRAAIAVLRRDPRLDFTSPRDVEALRSLVTYLLEAGDTGLAREALDAALAKRPDDSNLHEIRGRVLEHEGATKDEVEAAYQHALELDPRSPHALEALGRMAASSGRLEEALSLLCDQAVKRVPSEPAPSLRCAARLVVAGRQSEAEARLEALLREVPWSSAAALALARLHWDRQAGGSAIDLAQRAVRFGGGPEAHAFLEQIRQGG
jgi:Flp pilus assembly protein TadD